METQKKTILSGIQPTNALTIGNYLGALKQWVTLHSDYTCFYCIVDLHSLTVRQEPAALRKNTLSMLALYIASGLNPEDCTLFVQSHVPAHAELAWILGCYTYMGELNRMTQFKDKSEKHADNINSGLYTYPVLMAADILLYQAHLVPVGHDQKQHLELSRDVAMRFNNLHPDTFVVPEPYIPPVGARIMGLQFPEQKMSKSEANENDAILMLDDADTIRRKLKRAVTDSDGRIAFEPGKPGVSNLLTIYGAFQGMTVEQALAAFEGKGYGELKAAVAEATVDALTPIQSEYSRLMTDKTYLEGILKAGAEKAEYVANRTLAKVYKKIGLVPRPR